MRTRRTEAPYLYNFRFLTAESITLPAREMTQIGPAGRHFPERPSVTGASLDFEESALRINAGFLDLPYRSGTGLRLVPVLIFESRTAVKVLRLQPLDLAADRPDPEVSVKIAIERTSLFNPFSAGPAYPLRGLREIQLILAEPAGLGGLNDAWLADYRKLDRGWV